MRILLVEDEHRLADALEYVLKKENYLVDLARDGITAEEFGCTGLYDIIILDRMLPGRDGLKVLKSLRAKGIKSAVIFLTAKDSIDDRAEGLDAGADDYLVKPFSNKELLARIRALGRRPAAWNEDTMIGIGELKLDYKNYTVLLQDETIRLTAQESQLLEYLIRNKNQTLSKEQILNKIWGFNTEADINSVELYIYYLRKKLGKSGVGYELKTIRGAGYLLAEV
ncbi:MAG: response regulator transcription factor [Lachnospiraceae bacterium]